MKPWAPPQVYVVNREGRRLRRPIQYPSTEQFNLRARIEDINEFVDWCGRERLSYREGFARLMELWRQSEATRKRAG